MIFRIFSVYDTKVEAFMQPFFAPTRGAAIRMFSDTVNDPQTVFARHHADYILFELGEYHDHNAAFVMLDGPQSIGPATMFKEEV